MTPAAIAGIAANAVDSGCARKRDNRNPSLRPSCRVNELGRPAASHMEDVIE